MQGKYHSIGMVGIAARDIESFRGKINMGDRVQIIGIDNVDPSRGYHLLDLDTGLILKETGFDSIIPVRNGEITFDIGTIGMAARDFDLLNGKKIAMGSIVQIVGIDNVNPSRGYKLLDLSTGVMVIETGFNSIIPITFENDNDLSKNGKTR